MILGFVMLIWMTQILTGFTPLTSGPLVTFYDCASGERTELSGITMGNWVAKVSNFLVDDLDVEVGTRLRLGLPPHWLRIDWLLSCWNTGVVVSDTEADIAQTGPDLDATEPIKLASALAPFGMRFGQPPAGFIDIGVDVLSHSDYFDAFAEPSPQEPAWELDGMVVTHEEALTAAGAGNSQRTLASGTSLAHDAHLLVSAIVGGGSLVVVRHGTDEDIQRIVEQERVTAY